MLGDTAYKLAQETKRTQAHLPAYNKSLVEQLCRETRHIFAQLEALLQKVNPALGRSVDTRAVAAQLAALHATVKRNKRCLLAYHHLRLQFLKALFWSVGKIPDELKPQLSPQEQDFFSHYALLVSQYKHPFVGIDLNASELPPRDLFIEVRVLKDCGEIQLEKGSLLLTRNSQHHVKRSDVEQLISQGLLQHIG
ncbi:DNA replication protein psf1 [Dispira simplex]|nr:DNA replication protein psf1 [Dispira simplex]